MSLIFLIIAIVVCVFLWKSYTIRYDTVIAFTGGLGSGKTFQSVKISLKLLRRQRSRVKWHNRFERVKAFFSKKHKKDIWEQPLLYSSIPVRISKTEWAVMLKPEHLLLTKRIRQRSVVFIDEVGSWAKQFDYALPNIQDNFDELVRFFRHYTKGGYLVVNDQCSENIVLYIRRRINTVFNLMHFKKWFCLFYTVKVRNISISEEIKTVEEEDTEDNMTTLFGLLGFFKHYDTYCYSERYKTVPEWRERVYYKMKKNELLSVPEKRVKKKTNNEEDLDTLREPLQGMGDKND